MPHKLRGQETKPVLSRDAQTLLGHCQVKRYGRESGEPRKQIIICDTDLNCVALIQVYKLHSIVECASVTGDAGTVDSKRAVEIARAALPHKDDPKRMLSAIQEAVKAIAVRAID